MKVSLLEKLNTVFEARGLIKNVIRNGEMKTKLTCPDGFKSVNGKCERMTSQEIMKRHKAAKLAIRTRARNAGKNRVASQKSRLRSDKMRIRFKNQVNKVKAGG